jgi:hypothetical protein
MSFAGDLSTFDLLDLLAWVMGRKRSGLLQMSRLSTKKRFSFYEGLLQWSGSNDPRETIGQALVRDRLIGEEALFRTLLKQETDKRRLGEILIGDKLLTEEQLTQALRANARAHLHELFLWSDGRFEFDDKQGSKSSPSDLRIDLKPVLEEGRRRRELWRQLRRRFPAGEVTFRVAGDVASVDDPVLRQLVDLARHGKTLAAISLEARRSEYETALFLASLCDDGVLAVDRVREGAVETDPVGVITSSLAQAEALLKEGRFDAAREAYELVLGIDGVNQAAKKGLIAVADARQSAKAAKRVPLDKIPLLRIPPVDLAKQQFDPHEGFVLSRINGEWDVRSILKLCPIPEEETLLIFSRLLDRGVIDLG